MNDLTVPTPSGGALAATNSQRAVAEVQAALVMAAQRPRNMVAVLDKVANAFTRPLLAEAAEYEYARGGSSISGPSIRAAEAIAQMYGNNEYGFREIARSKDENGVGVSEVECFCYDYENNVRQVRSVQVRHWRDRQNKAGYALTDERDIYELTANMAQRRVRACILSVLPGDIIETAMAQAALTLKATADTSPAKMAEMVTAFANFGVTKEQIETRIQRRLDAIQPAQVVQLKRIYASLRDGMSTAESWFEQGAAADAEPKRKSEAKPKPEPKPEPPLPPEDQQSVKNIVAMIYPPAVDPMPTGAPGDPWVGAFTETRVEHPAPVEQIQSPEREPGQDDEERDEPPSPPISPGEVAWLERTAKTRKIDLAPLLASVGLSNASQLDRARFDRLRTMIVGKAA